MKILYFSPFYPPQGEAAAARAFWFKKVLEERGHSVELLNASRFLFRPASNKSGAFLRLVFENLAGIELFARILTSRSDRIILSSPPFFTVLWGALAARTSGQPYILDVRDLYPEVFFELGMIKETSIFAKGIRRLTYYLYAGAKEVITVTQGLCNEIEKYRVRRPSLIMNGYDKELFYPGDTNSKFQEFTLIFHGTLGKLQNVETLISLSRLLKNDDINILVAGEGPKAELLKSVEFPRFKYLGNLPFAEIPSLLRKCHVGLSFRTDDKIGKEAFPVKVFEYLGTGLPVVMAPKGEAGQIVEELGFGREFENKELEEMAAYIRKLKASKISAAGKVETYSREFQAAKILDLL